MKRADWDKLADDFESETCDITREETADRLKRYVGLAGIRKRNAVLVDLGCGVGTFIHRFGDRFRAVVGVEFAPRIIARARRRCADMANVTWHAIDIARAAKEIGRRGDLTVCFNVITSANRAKRTALWSSVSAVTRLRGFALVVVPSLESERMVVETAKGRAAQPRPGGLVERDGTWQKHYERAEIKAIFEGAGFAVKRIGRAHYPWSVEGMRETRARAAHRPWDWIGLAQRL